jgi:predicted RNA-binding protein
MKTNQGNELLIPRNEWVDPKLICGNDKQVLCSPVIQKAFERVLALHKPKHRIALFGLCTSKRPYSASVPWKLRKKMWGNVADLIITSNGGVIPIEFENCYPYLTYDAHGQKQYDEIYKYILGGRLFTFLKAFRYQFCVFHFRPNLRNHHMCLTVGAKAKTEGIIEDFAVLPAHDTYQKLFKEHSYWDEYYPEFHECLIPQVQEKLTDFSQRSAR